MKTNVHCAVLHSGEPLFCSNKQQFTACPYFGLTSQIMMRKVSFLVRGLVILKSHFEAVRQLFWDGPHNFELLSDDGDNTAALLSKLPKYTSGKALAGQQHLQ
ncbi:hypothetical protein AVEN_249531-1 [Araneus ventricosus]|uniref:Uncharacterized protein n=1 Tax=Araneus ventricosus TaxID=182803 RepID=A0A4Y2RHB2_ARAVE|nr:hypothetical protein AVEN_249531-1 [Araneus ventricosus]